MIRPVIKVSTLIIISSLFAGDISAQDLDSFQVDAVSWECMKCHDRDVPSGVNIWGRTNHPYGIDYKAYARLPWNIGRYEDPANLDPAIKLPEGRITCITCHEQRLPTKDEDTHGRRNLTEHGGNLCLNCHLRPGSR
jgi:hypothetical protein